MTVFRFIYFAVNDNILLFFIYCIYVQTAHAAQHQKNTQITEIKNWVKDLNVHFSKERKTQMIKKHNQFSSVQTLSHVWLFATPWIPTFQASLSITNSQGTLKLMSIESVMPSSHLILCHPLLLLPPIPPSIRAFSNESALRMRRPKYWSFSFSISPSKEHPGPISFRMDWLDLIAVQGTLKSLLQHHSSCRCLGAYSWDLC